MEVHTHTHTPHKKWSHYFYEFIMLFLAVTLGFFVENQREHYIEHRREKQYMRTMVQDLQADINSLNVVIGDFTNKMPAFDTIIEEFPKLPKKFSAPFARNIFKIVSYEDLVPNDRTLQQLKNAGGMRLIRKGAVSDSIMAYDIKMKDLMIEQQGLFDFYLKYRNRGELLNAEILNNTINPGVIGQYEKDNTNLLVTQDRSLLSKYHSFAYSYRAVARIYISQLKEMVLQAEELIHFIKTSYHIK
jgi:hypothetical protein